MWRITTSLFSSESHSRRNSANRRGMMYNNIDIDYKVMDFATCSLLKMLRNLST
jgi:hypothetical protein